MSLRLSIFQSSIRLSAKSYQLRQTPPSAGRGTSHAADAKDIRRRSRGAMRPSFAKALPQKEGAGNAGCALHPRSRVQRLCKETHTSIQVQRRHSGIPCAMVLRLMARSPRRRIRLVTVIGELAVLPDPVGLTKTSADLTPATGARTTRFCRTQPPVFAKRLGRALAPFVLRA